MIGARDASPAGSASSDWEDCEPEERFRMIWELELPADVSGTDLRVAMLSESFYNSGLARKGSVFTSWARTDDGTGDDVHRIGNWRSEPVKHQPKPHAGCCIERQSQSRLLVAAQRVLLFR